MVFKNKKNLYIHIFLVTIISTILICSMFFIISSINIMSRETKNIFDYTVKVRDSVEEIDKIFERAEVNVNVLSDSISNSYDSSRQQDKKYNMEYIKDIDGLIKSVLSNSPGIDGSWFQMNANLPFSAHTYNWYEFRDNQFINIRDQLEGNPSTMDRRITPDDDPYYFGAINEERSTWSDLYVDADTKIQMMTLSSPIYKGGTLVGVVGLDISVDNLQQVLKNMQLVLSNSELFLIDKKNNVILYQLFNDAQSTKKDYPFLNLFKGNQDEAVEYYDNFTKKVAIQLTLSNKYKLIITFEDGSLLGSLNRISVIIWALFSLLVLSLIYPYISKIKMLMVNEKRQDEIMPTEINKDNEESILEKMEKIKEEIDQEKNESP